MKGKAIRMSKQKNEIHIFCTFNKKNEFDKILETLFLEYLQGKNT